MSQEQRIMVMMRKVLAQIVKDTTPTAPGMRHPLREDTIRSIRECFILIAEREKMLYEAQGAKNLAKPYYKDDPEMSTVVPINEIKKKPL